MKLSRPEKMQLGAPLLADVARSGDFQDSEVIGFAEAQITLIPQET